MAYPSKPRPWRVDAGENFIDIEAANGRIVAHMAMPILAMRGDRAYRQSLRQARKIVAAINKPTAK